MPRVFSLLLAVPLGLVTSAEAPEPIAARALRTVRLEGSPDFLTVAGESLFVTNEPRDVVQRLDARTGALLAEIAVRHPCGAMTSTREHLWVASGKDRGLVGIGLVSNRVEVRAATGLADPEGEVMLAATEHGVFVVSDEGGLLAVVDPATGEVRARIRIKPRSYAVAAGFGALWVTNTGKAGAPGSVQRIDPTTRQVAAEVVTGPTPRFLAAGEGAVWTLNQGDGTVSRIDPGTNRAVASISVGPPETGGDITTGHGYVWVRGKATLLSVIDPRSNAVVARLGPPAGSGAVRATSEGVWVSAHDVNTLWLIPPKP